MGHGQLPAAGLSAVAGAVLAVAMAVAAAAMASAATPSSPGRDQQTAGDADADARLLAHEYLGLEPSRREALLARLMVANSARYRRCYANQTVEQVDEAFAKWVARTLRVQRRPVPEAFANYLLLTCP